MTAKGKTALLPHTGGRSVAGRLSPANHPSAVSAQLHLIAISPWPPRSKAPATSQKMYRESQEIRRRNRAGRPSISANQGWCRMARSLVRAAGPRRN